MTIPQENTENDLALSFSLFRLAGKRFRKNDEITLPEVFLIDETGEKIGRTSTVTARRMAEEKDLDLVEVAPNATPPVCRLMDFGIFLFEQKKKEKAQKKVKKATEVKGIRFGIRISQHDFDVKIRASQKFLEKGHSVKATLQFRGREIVHDQLGFQKMQEFESALAQYAQVEQSAKKQGRQITMLLSPKKTKGIATKAE